MTFTYDNEDLSTDLAKIRLMIGDTDSSDPLLQDEEIESFIDISNDDIYMAASYACNAISSKFSRLADTSIESVSVKYSQKSSNYSKLSRTLQSQSESVSPALPSVLGVSISEMQQQDDNTDRVKSVFDMKKFDNPATCDEDCYYNDC